MMGKAGTCVGGKGTPFFAEKEPGRVMKRFFRLAPGCRGGVPCPQPASFQRGAFRICWRRNRKGPAGPFRHQSNSEAILMITLSDSVLDDLRTFRGRNAARTIRIEKGSSG